MTGSWVQMGPRAGALAAVTDRDVRVGRLGQNCLPGHGELAVRNGLLCNARVCAVLVYLIRILNALT